MAQSVLGGVFLPKLLNFAPYKARRSDHHAHSITASRSSVSFSICPKAIVYCFWVATVGVYFSLGASLLILMHSGYIGGAVLDALLSSPKASEIDVTVYVRAEEKAKKIAALGLKTVSGGLPELEEAVANADIIFNCVLLKQVVFPRRPAD